MYANVVSLVLLLSTFCSNHFSKKIQILLGALFMHISQCKLILFEKKRIL